jgi:hypothetical protein
MRALLFALILALPARAETEVDLELVLAVDISRSMSVADLAIQRHGYAEALQSAEVLAAIRGGFTGRIAITYVEWSGAGRQRVLADWTLVETAADAAALAARIAAETGGSLSRTSISGGLLFAARRFETSPFTAPRRVIDISGDGPNNEGPPVTAARDAVLARGITINGLPLMSGLAADPIWHIDNLDRYYRDCVTGGPGAFVVPVRSMGAFPAAVRRKLVLEISGLAAAGLRLAQAAARPPADCLIGERVNERRGRAP